MVTHLHLDARAFSRLATERAVSTVAFDVDGFERAVLAHFVMRRKTPIRDSTRIS